MKDLSHQDIEPPYRMPLETGDIRHLDEEPLAGDVFEAGLDNTEFHGT